MKVTLIQTDLHWEDPKKNREHFARLIRSVKEKTDLIVLPEMFTTGFSMQPEKIAEDSQGETLSWLTELAREKNSVITGSVAVKEKGAYYNRLFWVGPAGNVEQYDKRHLFRLAKEDEHYTPGRDKIHPQIGDWTICPLICYDLRFPVWSRNVFKEGKWRYDVLIYVANWPEVRNHVWKSLLVARAIENQCYVIGVNRIGKDGNGYPHSGDSVVLNPRGEIISQPKANQEHIETIELDKSYLDDFIRAFPVGLDADAFKLA